jgi:hypothetical protein
VSADYSGFATGTPVATIGSDSPPCTGCGRNRQQIADSRGNVVSISLGKAPDGRWWCNGCFAAAGRPV